LAAGRLEAHWDEVASLLDIVVRCRVAGGAEFESIQWDDKAGMGPIGGTLVAECGPLVVELRPRSDGSSVELELSLEATRDATILEVALAMRPRVEEAIPTSVLYSGLQSWDTAGRTPAVGTIGEPLNVESWWCVGLATDSGAGLAAAAASARRHGTLFAFENGELLAVFREPPGLPHTAPLWRARRGAHWTSEELRLAAGPNVQQALAAVTTGRRKAPVPVGWLSWYHYGAWIDPDEIERNLKVIRDGDLKGLGYQVIQIDDGWQESWGDWTPNGRFKPRMEKLIAKIKDAGMAPGIWTAPFLVAPDSRFALEAPANWFLRDPATGRKCVDPAEEPLRTFYVLDLGRPAVRRHLEQTYARLREMGFDYFKIDFLYAGAYSGARELRSGLEAIRRGVGDRYLLACGAPLLPVVGVADGCRVGIDTCTPLFDFETGEPRPAYVRDEIWEIARNLTARQPLAGWFQLDADVALAGGNASVDEARQLISLVAISGGPFFASDDLGRLPPERFQLLANPEVLALAGGQAAAPDWELGTDDAPAAVWRRPGLLAVFNWSQQEKALDVAVPGRWLARDIWAREDVGPVEDKIALTLPPSGVKLLGLRDGSL
jgi:hypothetical protein